MHGVRPLPAGGGIPIISTSILQNAVIPMAKTKPKPANSTVTNKRLVSRSAEAKRGGFKAKKPDINATQRAIEYLFSTNKSSIDAKMESIGLKPKSKADAHRRNQIEKAVRDGILSQQTLSNWLDEVEGWGNHQIQFFDVTTSGGRQWRTGKKAVDAIEGLGAWDLVDAPRPLWPGDEPQIYSIVHIGSRLRISWAEERIYLDPCEAKNIEDEDYLWKAYKKQHKRCFHHFDFDATQGQASLIMAKLPAGGKYSDLRERLLSDLAPYVPSAALEQVKLQPTLRKLEKEPDVIRRSLSLQTADQAKIEVTSANRKEDAFANPLLKSLRDDILDGTSPTKGMFYWLVDTNGIQRLIGSRVYPKQNRFSIEGQCIESEVMDVLRSMRAIG